MHSKDHDASSICNFSSRFIDTRGDYKVILQLLFEISPILRIISEGFIKQEGNYEKVGENTHPKSDGVYDMWHVK